MYASELLRNASSFAPLTDWLARLLAQAQTAFFSVNTHRAEAFHDVLRLDVVSGLGETPAAYGWHVDSLLNVRLEAADEPPVRTPQPADEPRTSPPPDRGIEKRIYRVPRTKGRQKLLLLTGWPANEAA